MDYIIGPRRRNDEENIRNDVRTWATWDHYPIYDRIQDEEQTKNFPKGMRMKKWTGWKPKADEQTIEFKRKVMEKNDDKSDEDLVTTQRTLVISAGEVAHHTKAEGENCTKYAGKRQIT